MTIRFQFIYADFAIAWRSRRRRHGGRTPAQLREFRLAGLFCVGLVLVVAALIYLAATVVLDWAWLIILPVCCFGPLLRRPANPVGTPADWERNPLSRVMVEFTLTPTQLQFMTPFCRHFIGWPAVTGIFENEHGIFIAVAEDSHLIPKRAFATKEEMQQFHALLISHHLAAQ